MGKVQKFHHRATLKQVNKPFKSKHATKSSIKDKSKGKVNSSGISLASKKDLNSHDRRLRKKNLLLNKKAAMEASVAVFNGKEGATKIVALVPLTTDITSIDAARRLFDASNVIFPESYGNFVSMSPNVIKHKIQFLLLERNLYSILDGVKVADYVVFVLSADIEVDPLGELIIGAIQSQGIPTSFNFVDKLKHHPPKNQPDIKKSLSSFINYFFPENDKIFSIESDQDCLSVIRSIGTQIPKTISWRENHPYMFADNLDYTEDPNTPGLGTLKVTGFVRGVHWNPNRLVHIQDLGDFQIKGIESARNPYLTEHQLTQVKEYIRVEPDQTKIDSLQAYQEVDPLAGEQTWPTEQELEEADNQNPHYEGEKKLTKKVPKGMSAYQAAWIMESDEEDDDMDDDESISKDDNEEDEEEYEEVPIEDQQDDDEEEEELTNEEEMKQYNAYLASRMAEYQGQKEFPDEVDTPLNESAITRFQRYRGMLSIRTSPWDPYENLPSDYSRIFMLQDYHRTKKRVIALNSGDEEAALSARVGAYVTIHVANVPNTILKTHNVKNPFVLFGLLQHENKMTVVNYNILRTTEYKEPIKSKDPLIVQSGFRRYSVRPIFSQTAKKSKPPNNVYKFERFLPHHDAFCMSFYGPVEFGSAPCLVFKSGTDTNDATLVAIGSFKDTDPTRIIAKRIILTGHPFKVNRRSAVVRYMFFNKEDVAWFKPVQLCTKFGRVGHIKDSIGTHGYMKCVFDGPIKQHDTVCLYLYKRIYPKWNTALFNRLNN